MSQMHFSSKAQYAVLFGLWVKPRAGYRRGPPDLPPAKSGPGKTVKYYTVQI